VAILAAVGVVAAVSAFGLAHDPSEARPVLIGKQAPSFEARTLDGSRTVRLRDLRGQVVVLNFWSSWCSACIAEHAALTRAWTRFRDRGVVVAGMDFDDARGAAIAFAERLGIGYPVLADPGDRTALAYGVAAPPETFLIGPGGRIESKWVGPVPYDELAARIDSLLESGR
jgi:cytochrome c biogenesis protein CcmG/thiol:disulfide interchange protein DsbE